MTLERHEVELKAKDNISPVMKQVGVNSAAAAKQTEQAWKQTGRSMEDVQRRAQTLGAGIGALVGVSALAGRSYASQQQQLVALQRAYGSSTADMVRFTEQLQKQTVYSDDAARQSGIYASTLIQNYGLAVDQIEQLIARSADLATVNVDSQGKMLGLTDAVSRASAAIRGEAEAAELLGVSMSDSFLAAEAAKRGISGWSTTMTEAEKAQFRFVVFMEQSNYAMGSAAELADTNAGKARQLMNQVQDLAQAFGGSLGPMGEYLSVLGDMALIAPIAGMGIGKVGAALGALGLGAGAIGPLALLAGGGALAYGYAQGDIGSTQVNTGANVFFREAAELFNLLTPGSIMNTDKYNEQLNENTVGDAVLSMFRGPGESDEDATRRVNAMLGNPTNQPFADGDVDWKKLVDYIQSEAKRTGVSAPTYLQTQAQSTAGMIQDPATGVWMPRTDYMNYLSERGNWNAAPEFSMLGRIAAGIPPDPFGTGEAGLPTSLTMRSAYMRGGSGAVANDLALSGGQPVTLTDSQQEARRIAEITSRLGEQNAAYLGVALGIDSVDDAMKSYKATQDGLLASESVYSQQISEFSSQVNAQDAAYEILQKRQQEGIALTQEQTEFMNNYAAANEQGTAAVENATISQGILAQQYLLNMEKSDQMKGAMVDTTDAVSDLVDVLYEFILALDGVPSEVRTEIILNKDPALAALYEFLDLVPDSLTIPLYVSGQDVQNFLGGGRQLGGMVPGAALGRVVGSRYTLVGENGPELLAGGQGGMVIPASASRARMRGSGGEGMVFNNPIINLYPVDANVSGQIREWAIGAAR